MTSSPEHAIAADDRKELNAHRGSRRPARWVHTLAGWMDTKFKIPGTPIRFGFDPIIGLLPIAGDTVTLLIGAAMLFEARRLRLGWRVRLAIARNLLIDWLIGLIPLADIIFDTQFKAHAKNAALLERAANEPA